jgi:hypothetical protein
MGKLLALALACTLVGAVFFQPIMLGRPRKAVEKAESQPSPTDQPTESTP